MRIAHAHTCDYRGAMSIPARLAQRQRAAGHESVVAVKWQDTDAAHTMAVLGPAEPGAATWPTACLALALKPLVGKARGAGRLAHALWHLPIAVERGFADRRRARCLRSGHEDFEYPATWNLLRRLPVRPEVLHLHNLHGGYFDLRALPWLTRRLPTVATLHDAWLMTGHCAQPAGCERWRTGCGECPDLRRYPSIEVDATSHNWRRKQSIYARCSMHVVAPSQWMLDMARASMLAPAMASARVIWNGIDLGIFAPGDKATARAELGLPLAAHVLAFSATSFLTNDYKDWPTIRGAVEALARRRLPKPVVLLAIGDMGTTEQFGDAEIRYMDLVRDQTAVARMYRAADLCLHAAHGETFCVSIAEARACGAPTVATAVDGIPEQVRSLTDRYVVCPAHAPDEATGILVGRGDPDAMADAAALLLSDEPLRDQLSANAALDARERFGFERMAEAYMDLYREAIAEHHARPRIRR